MKQINVRLTDETHAKLQAIAKAEHRSMNNMLVALIERASISQGRGRSPSTPKGERESAH